MKMGLEAAALSQFFKPPASPSTEIMAAAVSTLTACKVGFRRLAERNSTQNHGLHLSRRERRGG